MTKFEVQCTLPPSAVTYVSAPNARGTLDIVWSCLGILLICTWSILHLNVPLQTTPSRKREKYLRGGFRVSNSIMWMLLNVLAPEWSLGKAWADYRAVCSVEADFNALKDEDGVPWTRMHTYLANLGGFTIKFEELTAPAPQPEGVERAEEDDNSMLGRTTPEGSPEDSPEGSPDGSTTGDSGLAGGDHESPQPHHPLPATETPTALGSGNKEKKQDDLPLTIRTRLNTRRQISDEESKYALQAAERASRRVGVIQWEENEMNWTTVSEAIKNVRLSHFQNDWETSRFLKVYEHWYRNVEALKGDQWVLDANQLLLARQFGIIEKLPAILEDDVSDRNKGDLFVKVIALSQVLWFVVQLIVRLSWRVPTSQLEIMTLAFAVCTAFTYILLLDKPKDVRYSVTVRAVRYATPQELIRLALAGPTMYAYSRRGIAIPNNAIHADRNRSGERFNLELLHGVTFSIAIFGAVHCVAWEFIFPNDIEQRLWQASSIVTAATIPTAFILLALHQYVWRWFCFEKTFAGFVKSPRSVISGNVIVFFFGISFCIARLFILVEVFRSLAFLPPEAFATTWANVLPHIG